jgi:AraC family transcriptional regulator, carnitine catabolism transcriptional activator
VDGHVLSEKIRNTGGLILSGTAPHRFGLLLVPGFSALGLALVTEPLFIANWIGGRAVFAWTTLSVDGLAVASSAGSQVPVQAALSGDMPFDTVMVIASFNARPAAEDRRILQWLRSVARRGVALGAVETGSEVLAAAGLLDGREVPVHWYNSTGAQERYPALQVRRALYSADPQRPVSAGATATLDLMLTLIARQGGQALADEVALHLLVDGRRDGGRAQRTDLAPGPATGTDPVQRVLAIMETTLEDPVPVTSLARAAGMSQRQLLRLFHARFGKSLARTYADLRMERAHQLVQQTALSLTEVAMASGFGSLEAFSRAYRRSFGSAPSRDRGQTTGTTVFRRSAGP